MCVYKCYCSFLVLFRRISVNLPKWAGMFLFTAGLALTTSTVRSGGRAAPCPLPGPCCALSPARDRRVLPASASPESWRSRWSPPVSFSALSQSLKRETWSTGLAHSSLIGWWCTMCWSISGENAYFPPVQRHAVRNVNPPKAESW